MTIIIVDVKTGSNSKSISKVGDNHYLVNVKELPKKGKANKAVIKILNDFFNAPVFLLSGYASSRKIFEVSL
jgi:uncharacterized protein YggU (UPF0235/DUF167 family)